MKLKKFAAMMLAGVMAVSMLAGCSGKGTNGGNNGANQPEPTPETGIVAAFNNEQDEDNEVKVTFSSNASLENAVKKAVEVAGANTDANDIAFSVGQSVGFANSALDFAEHGDEKGITDGGTRTALYVNKFVSGVRYNEDFAIDAAVRNMNDVVAALDEDTLATNHNDDVDYFELSYTGNACMVSVPQEDGSTDWYVVYTITQTAEKAHFKAN